MIGRYSGELLFDLVEVLPEVHRSRQDGDAASERHIHHSVRRLLPRGGHAARRGTRRLNRCGVRRTPLPWRCHRRCHGHAWHRRLAVRRHRIDRRHRVRHRGHWVWHRSHGRCHGHAWHRSTVGSSVPTSRWSRLRMRRHGHRLHGLHWLHRHARHGLHGHGRCGLRCVTSDRLRSRSCSPRRRYRLHWLDRRHWRWLHWLHWLRSPLGLGRRARFLLGHRPASPRRIAKIVAISASSGGRCRGRHFGFLGPAQLGVVARFDRGIGQTSFGIRELVQHPRPNLGMLARALRAHARNGAVRSGCNRLGIGFKHPQPEQLIVILGPRRAETEPLLIRIKCF